jgi:hypothetical protein
MLVLVDYAADAVTLANVQSTDLFLIGDRRVAP